MAAVGDEENDEGISTLAEYMERVEEQELEADLVLGGDDGKECTYKQGYMKRQAVFSCLTCTPSEEAGFCTACSFACHDGHDVVELWTRRHFRCDCGNSKYGQGICKLQADKDIENTENVYNQNYKGVYCTCHRAYPDPEGTALGEMLQCCICEDWFHELHLGLPPALQELAIKSAVIDTSSLENLVCCVQKHTEFPRDEDGEPLFDELICKSCVPKCLFLSKYPDLIIAPSAVPDASADAVEIVDEVDGSGNANDKHAPLIPTTVLNTEGDHANVHQANFVACETPNVVEQDCEVQQGLPSVNGNISRATAANEDTTIVCPCKLKKEGSAAVFQPGQALFLVKGWRTHLCRCPDCLLMYEQRGIGFLLDSDDTLQAYEASAKRKREESLAQVDGSELMKGLPHVQQIELLRGFNDMTSQLKTFLAPFGEDGRTVTSADIQEFFADLNQKKRRHL